MKRCYTVIAFCILVAGCDRGSRSITGPSPGPVPTDTPTVSYTLTGRIQDELGEPVSGAAVLLVQGQNPGRTTVSDELGQYRFDNLRGFVVVRAIKADYRDGVASGVMDADRTLMVTMTPYRRLQLTVGTTLHGTVQDPPCDPVRWDAIAPCQLIFFTPPATGVYELVLTWNGPHELDLLIDGSLSLYFYQPGAPGKLRASLSAQAGVQREIRIHSYYGPQAFELTASHGGGQP